MATPNPTPILLANGIDTDHPHPGYPFMHLPRATKAEIPTFTHGKAYFPNPEKPDYALSGGKYQIVPDPHSSNIFWVIITHPTQGRTVEAYYVPTVDNAPLTPTEHNDALQQLENHISATARRGILLERDGGYGYDGIDFVRPYTQNNPVANLTKNVPVPDCTTHTADQYLNSIDITQDFSHITYDPHQAYALFIGEGNRNINREIWMKHHLRTWAEQRTTDSLPLNRCIVSFTAPEISEKHLIDSTEFARRLRVTTSTFKTYSHRGIIPEPQLKKGRKNYWSQPVVEHVVQQREKPEAPEPQSPTEDSKELATRREKMRQALTIRMPLPNLRSLLRTRQSATFFKPEPSDVDAAVAGNTHGYATNKWQTTRLRSADMFTDFIRNQASGYPVPSTDLAKDLQAYASIDPNNVGAVVRSFSRMVDQHIERTKHFCNTLDTATLRSKEQVEQRMEKIKSDSVRYLKAFSEAPLPYLIEQGLDSLNN